MLTKRDKEYITVLVILMLFALTDFGLGLYGTINSNQKQNKPTTYTQQFDVALSTQVVPSNNSTQLQLYQEIPLYSTIAQPSGGNFAPVSFVIANYDILGFTSGTNYPVMSVIGSVVYTDGSSIQIQGVVVRNITITADGTITSNQLISTNIAIVGGTGSYKGAYGTWLSVQSQPFVTRISTTFAVPLWLSTNVF